MPRNIIAEIRLRNVRSKSALSCASRIVKKRIVSTEIKSRDAIAQVISKVRDVGISRQDAYQEKRPYIHKHYVQARYAARKVSSGITEFYHQQNSDEQKQYSRIKLADWGKLNNESFSNAQKAILAQYKSEVRENTQGINDTASAYKFIALGARVKALVETEITIAVQKDVHFIIDACMGFPLKTDHGTVTLKELNHDMLLRLFPYLVGTDVSEDPAAIIAAVILNDTPYYLNRLKIVKTREGISSINEIIRNPNKFSRKALGEAIKLSNAIERMDLNSPEILALETYLN
jgi:hypothetical protein